MQALRNKSSACFQVSWPWRA